MFKTPNIQIFALDIEEMAFFAKGAFVFSLYMTEASWSCPCAGAQGGQSCATL